MKVHHLDCGSMCPCGGSVLSSIIPREVVCHCLLIETNDGLVLVDTGLGKADIENPRRLGLMSNILGVDTKGTLSAAEQVEKLGYSINDVRHLIPTHLDLDHAGGIPDFPKAKVHVHRNELESAINPKNFKQKERYRKCHWNEETNWEVIESFDGEKWFGFDSVRSINGLPPEILIIPLFGHTEGQIGIAVKSEGKWILHCGDSYYDQCEINGEGNLKLGWKIFQRIVHTNYKKAMNNQKRLGELFNNHSDEVDLICAHDAHVFKSMKNG